MRIFLFITLCFVSQLFQLPRVAFAEELRGAASGNLPVGIDGTFAYIDPSISKLIEIDSTGRVVWDWVIPPLGGNLYSGADVEWLPTKESFLFVVPGSGVYEVSKRNKAITWQCKTEFISHDADRLPNGDTIFVNGWDSDDAPIVTLVDSNCTEKKKLYAKDLKLKTDDQRLASSEKYSNTHINAVQVLPDDTWLISLRNFNQFILLSSDFKVLKGWRKTRRGHDPLLTEDGSIFFAQHGKGQALLHIKPDRSREVIFTSTAPEWTPLRTIQLLRKEYFLITGSQSIGIVDKSGQLVWAIKLHGFQPQKGVRERGSPFIYKAVFIPSAR